ncbi:MAG: hypothetical protein KC933_19900 [Myxococcales bacterium]|nr:hypothetical protein [Myxococcales bacterium]MCB9645641.1 hypothetical protein [Deltaproteobacteria bacterium]
MKRFTKTVLSVSATLALVTGVYLRGAEARAPSVATCTVTVEHRLNNNLTSSYSSSFSVQAGQPFDDDRSTATRQKTFSATLQDGAVPVVSIDYFEDVSVFDAVSVGTTLELPRRGTTYTTSGRNGFFTSNPSSANHITSYSLACVR